MRPLPSLVTERQRASLSDDEVRPGDAHVGVDELLPQLAPRLARQIFDSLVSRRVQLLLEQLGDVLAGLVNGRRDDMIGRLARELNDILAQVGLHRFDALGDEPVVEPDLLRDHGLALDNQLDAPVARQLRHVLARRLGVLGEIDVAARSPHVALGHFEVVVEMLYGVRLNGPAALAQLFPVGRGRSGVKACGMESGVEAPQALLHLGVLEGVRRALLELRRLRLHGHLPRIPSPSMGEG